VFLTCNAWRQLAENIIESGLAKGDRVIVHGTLKQRSYEAKDGTKRTACELEVIEIGPSLLFAVATPQKTDRQRPSTMPDPAGSPSADPWAQPVGAAAAPPF
jgi:single-strand DNA-binding protein